MSKLGIQKVIDRIFVLRQEIAVLKEEEEQLSEAIKNEMSQHGINQMEGTIAYAVLIERQTGSISPVDYYEAIDGDVNKLLETISVRKTTDKKSGTVGADYYLSKEEIDEISDYRTSLSLTIKSMQQTPQATKNTKGAKHITPKFKTA